MLEILGILLLSIVVLLAVLILVIVSFIKFSPVFGGKASRERIIGYQKSPNYSGGQFHNLMPMNTVYETEDFIDESFKPRATRQPDFDIPFQKVNPQDLENRGTAPRFIWFGHSTFLLQMEGKNILIDPMFSKVPSPVQGIGKKRYSKGLPLEIKELPMIDAVLLTHDHYDHLDYRSIKKIKDKVKRFYTPLGMSGHLVAWGVADENVEELDWFDTAQLGNIELRLTPSHHYSGRSLTDRFQTLWGGWILKSEDHNIYLSGDGGYGPHFKQIGEAYGPFDFAMIECGQYSRFWRQNHLFPEQTAQVALDVKAKLVMPIHWGAFTLAMHGWSDSIERLLKKAQEWNIAITTPQIGELLALDGNDYPTGSWWRRPQTT